MHSATLLDATSIEQFGSELTALESAVKEQLGDSDRQYIRRIIRIQRALCVLGRGLIYGSLPALVTPAFLPILGLGTMSLALGKILENMEVGHNVLHGQWDWMCDPSIHSQRWEWDIVCPADQWKHSHNVSHHTWTNVVGRDRDVGYEILRVSDLQEWKPAHLFQPFYNLLLALLFEWGVALHDIDLGPVQRGEEPVSSIFPKLRAIGEKARRQILKDYVVFPLLAGPLFLPVLLANAAANTIRNVWTYSVIFCGHFPDGVRHFTEADVHNETRGQWYLRQVLGSCNIEGGGVFHVLTGNLSFQIEHHLFPDMPSNRYKEVAPKVREICARYGIPYNTGSFGRQLGTTLRTIFRLALPSSAITARA